MTEPEVAAAQTALDGLPPEWLTPTLTASVLRRAALVAVHRKVNAQVSAARASVASTLSAIEAGDVADATLAALVSGRAHLAQILDAQSVLPAPSIDSAASATALEVAGRAVAQCAPAVPLVLDYQAELVLWRSYILTNSGLSPDGPIATDADRAAQSVWSDADGQVMAWRQGLASWRSLPLASNDVLGLLAGAQSYIALAAELAPIVEAADAQTSAANTARRAAGLNWSAT
jgi:hypothetical protein